MLTLMLQVHASLTLSITINTSKPSYSTGENISIYGNLTRNGTPFTGLVALQVNDPIENTVILRTLKTGSAPEIGQIQILDFYSSDSAGNPKTTFRKAEHMHFNITAYNNSTSSLSVLLIANAYDADNSTLGLSIGFNGEILGKSAIKFYPSFYVPEEAPTGNATAYASAFTGWPVVQGTPYCLEKSASFQITEAEGGSGLQTQTHVISQMQSSNSIGTYDFAFKLLGKEKLGTYRAYVTSSYGAEKAYSETTFQVNGWTAIVYGNTYIIQPQSNSYLTNFKFNETFVEDSWKGQLSFDVIIPTGSGYCNLTIPKNLTKGIPPTPSWRVRRDGSDITGSANIWDNETHTFIYFTYSQGSHTIDISGTWVVPEFPDFMILLIITMAILAAAIIGKKASSTRQKNKFNI